MAKLCLNGVVVMGNWYILFVKTGREQKIADEINRVLKDILIKAFIPMKENYFRRNGKVKKELKIMFPSYVFIDMETGDLNGNKKK